MHARRYRSELLALLAFLFVLSNGALLSLAASTDRHSKTRLHPAVALGSPEAADGDQRQYTIDIDSSMPVQTISRFDTSENVYVLTFDAGADRGYASPILDTLAANGIAASFGVTGMWLSRIRISSDGWWRRATTS